MPSTVSKHITKKVATKERPKNSRSIQAEENTRSVASQMDMDVSNLLAKQVQQSKQSSEEAQIESLPEQIAGAFYLPLKMDADQAWERISNAMSKLDKMDLGTLEEDDKYTAYGLQYFRDTFMLARSKLVEVEGIDGNFLELRRLEGDGFVFADEFKKNLVEQLSDVVEDAECSIPIAAEETIDPLLQYLDLSDEDNAAEMITLWLNDLRPRGGVKYNQARIFESLSSLAWNATDETNFKVLADYSDDIIDCTLQVINHEETKHLPTVYFAALCLNTFVKGDAVNDELKTWETVGAICETINHWCVLGSEANYASQQVTSSTQIFELLLSTLEVFASQILNERSDRITALVSDVVGKMNTVANSAERIEALAQALNVNTVEDDE